MSNGASNDANSLKKVISDNANGRGLFMTPADGNTFARANSIATVRTTEDGTKFEMPAFFSGYNSASQKLDWILIDVDGDGDFSAGTDMAIALAGLFDGPLTPQNFI